jgi:hypothetical protein
VSDQQLTRELAVRVMGWKTAPGRFLKPRRSWTPMSRFKPLDRIEDAIQLLDEAGAKYRLSADGKGTFTADVRVGGRKGKASGSAKARVIAIALAIALGIGVSS